MQSLHKPDKGSSRAVAPSRPAISLASADSAPLPVGFEFSSSPSTSAMFAGPPLHLLERELSDSQVSDSQVIQRVCFGFVPKTGLYSTG